MKQAWFRSKLLSHTAFIVFFTLLFWIMRLPFFSIPLFFEEGIFANIFINRIHGPQYGQIGRIDGEEIYMGLLHPGFIYESMAISGQVFQAVVPLKGIPQEAMNFWIRADFAIFQLLFWLWIIFILILAESKNPKFRFSPVLKISLTILSITPLAVNTSYILQVDNTVGVLLAGFFAGFLLLWYLGLLQTRVLYLVSALSGMLWGIGKNEWSILLLLSMLFTAAFVVFRRWYWKQATSIRTDLAVILLHLAGCAAGNGLNYLFDPSNYMAGFDLLFTRAAAIGPGFAAQGAMQAWVNTLIYRSPYLFLGMIGSILLFFMCVQRIKEIPAVFVWGASLSVLLFFFFFFASYQTELRYFIVSYVLQVALFGMAFFMFPATRRVVFYGKVGLVLILVLSLVQYGQSLGQLARERETRTSSDLYRYFQHQNELSEKTGCIPGLDIADVFEDDSTDYLSYTLYYEHSAAIIEQYGKRFCRQ